MNTKPQAAVIQPTGEVSMFIESIDDYLKNKKTYDERLASLTKDEADALKRGEVITL